MGALRHDAHLQLTREYGLAPFVPSLIELAAVALNPFTLDLMRRMPCAQAVVHEEWLFGRYCAKVHQVFDGTISQICIQVVALVTGKRRCNVMAVMDQRRGPLAGFSANESVVPLEPARQRPARFGRA